MKLATTSLFEDIHQLHLKDLEEYFSIDRIEDQYLEFKSGEVTIDKILKEVAAFLNAEGGILIIGAPRELERTTKAGICKGPLTSSSFESAETIKIYLSNDIVPPPPSIDLVQIKENGLNVFVMKIPASPMGPHQVLGNGKYYIRDGDKSRPATHREVEKMFVNRINGNLDMQLQVTKEKNHLHVQVTIHNLSSNSAKEPRLRILAKPVLGNKTMHKEYTCPEKHLHHRHSWVEEISIPYAHEIIYIQADVWGKGLITKTKAAFVEIIGNRTELLATYYSEAINAKSVEEFYSSKKYLMS